MWEEREQKAAVPAVTKILFLFMILSLFLIFLPGRLVARGLSIDYLSRQSSSHLNICVSLHLG